MTSVKKISLHKKQLSVSANFIVFGSRNNLLVVAVKTCSVNVQMCYSKPLFISNNNIQLHILLLAVVG